MLDYINTGKPAVTALPNSFTHNEIVKKNITTCKSDDLTLFNTIGIFPVFQRISKLQFGQRTIYQKTSFKTKNRDRQ